MAKIIKSEMKNHKSLRVLIVEDLEDDALLIIRALKKGGYDPVHERVESAAAMKKALKGKSWDIILCDYKLPKFDAPSAIALLKETNIDIPIIIVSGVIGEEMAVACMRLGAHDYIMKDNLSRLCPAIARELQEVEVRNKKSQAESKLHESEERFRILTDSSPTAILLYQNNKWVYANSAATEITGYTGEEFLSMNFWDIVHPDDKQMVQERGEKRQRGEAVTRRYEFRIVSKDGSVKWVDLSGETIVVGGSPAGIISVLDVTERRRMEDEIRRMALQDQLTEIYNRRGFIAIAEQQLKAANRTNKKLLLFFIDLDDMKLTNDNWGHKEGDRLLVDAADILKQTFRESDIIARIGGDEFAVLALDASEPAEKVLLRLEEQINYHNVLPNHHYTISLSVGAVIYDPEIPCSLDELMSKADRLMYEQKKARRRKKTREA